MYRFVRIISSVVALSVSTCVSPYDVRFNNTLKVITVEGRLTDEEKEQQIEIAEAEFVNDAMYKLPIEGLVVQLKINGKEVISMTNKENYVYVLPMGFRVKAGNRYQLIFTKPDGTRYESDEELMQTVPTIDTVYHVFSTDGFERKEKQYPSHSIYLNYQDTPHEKNYYVWSWTLWERQNLCVSTDYYDLYCAQPCWEILQSESIDILSDTFTDGRGVVGKKVAEIPFYQPFGALLEVRQQRISEKAYQFLKLLRDQNQGTGSLVDTPPEALIGNIQNVTNPNEEVAGAFMVASTQTKMYWLSREEAIDKVRPVGLLWRDPIVRPTAITAPCIASSTRTPFQPQGWRP